MLSPVLQSILIVKACMMKLMWREGSWVLFCLYMQGLPLIRPRPRFLTNAAGKWTELYLILICTNVAQFVDKRTFSVYILKWVIKLWDHYRIRGSQAFGSLWQSSDMSGWPNLLNEKPIFLRKERKIPWYAGLNTCSWEKKGIILWLQGCACIGVQ